MKDKIKNFFKSNTAKLEKNDYIILFVIVLLYSLLSFYKLGSLTNPETFVVDTKGLSKEIVLKVSGDSKHVTNMRYFNGIKPGSYKILGSSDNKNYRVIGSTDKEAYVFGWYDVHITDNNNLKYIKLVVDTSEASLGEIKLDGGVTLISTDSYSEKLIDEQDTVPTEISYYNSTYFDEVYFARTAYEYANEMPAYEWVHPPFGKLVQSIPIRIMGMNPFSYRLVGNIAGILLIVVMYAFGKALFKNRGYAVFAALLMALDGFHFAQTRMGTIDSQLVLYILTSYFFMYRYLSMAKDDSIKKKIFNLILSGIFISFAISTKWTGLFAGFGLFILFIGHFYYTFLRKKKELTQKNKKDIKKIFYTCVSVFIVIPILMYVMCYFSNPNINIFKVDSFNSLFDVTNQVYKYHSTLTATHPYSSDWYTWPASLKPVWLYTSSVVDGSRGTISAVGNIVVWWSSFIGILSCIYFSVKKDKRAITLLIGFLCLFVPYMQIGRCMFLYHYFPALPFAMLGLTLLIQKITNKFNKKWIPWLFIILALIWFIIYYPIVSGLPISDSLIKSLRFFPEWYF